MVRHATAQVDLASARAERGPVIAGARTILSTERGASPIAAERIDENGHEKMLDLVRAGDRYGRVEKRGSIPDMVMISEPPAKIEDRAVLGHW